MSGRFSWVLALIVVALSGALLGLVGSGDSGSRSPVSVPSDAESARVTALRTEFPDGDQVPAVLVVTRADGTALTPADVDAAGQARQRMLAVAGTDGAAGPPVVVSDDDQAAVTTVPLSG